MAERRTLAANGCRSVARNNGIRDKHALAHHAPPHASLTFRMALFRTALNYALFRTGI